MADRRFPASFPRTCTSGPRPLSACRPRVPAPCMLVSKFAAAPRVGAFVLAQAPAGQKLAGAMGKTKKSFYAVRVGRNVGVYNSWAECEAEVKRYPGAVYKGFSDRTEADSFAYAGPSGSARERYARDFPSSRSRYSVSSYQRTTGQRSDCTTGWSRASSTYHGNPGSSGSSDDRGVPAVYSDGCCFNNGRSNAQAGVGVYWGPGHTHNVSERLQGHPTNQRAEVVSASRALETALEQGLSAVEVKTDSTYTIKAMTEWVPHWKRNGWQTVQGSEVKNKDDFVRLDQLCKQINVKWTHVPGHQGIHGNEQADRLAKAGSQQ